MKFSVKDFFRECDQIVTFTEEIIIGKLPHFLCSVFCAFMGDYKILETLLIFCHDITTAFDSRENSHATTIKEGSTQCIKT